MDRLGQSEDRYSFRLKWQLKTEKPIEAFLRQLVVQICLEARMQGVAPGAIAWRFSIPSSLPSARASQYTELIGEILSDLSGRSEGAVSLSYPLESSAAMAFRVGKGDMAGALSIIVDTGGHSSDIAFYGGAELTTLWEGSIELGGQRIFVDDWVADRR